MLLATVGVLRGSCAAAPRIAVFGGTGFIGSRACQVLVESGCEVISVARKGVPPSWAEDVWTKQVKWIAADADEEFPIEALGHLSACIDCVGTDPRELRFQPDEKDRAAEPFDEQVTRKIASVAKGAGAARFVYLSISSDFHEGFGGAYEGFVNSKLKAERAAREIFGDANVAVVAPLTMTAPGALGDAKVALLTNPLVTGAVSITQFFNKAGWRGEDFMMKCDTTPPIAVEVAARAAAAAALGLSASLPRATASQLGFEIEDRYAQLSRGYEGSEVEFSDGNSEIVRIVEQAGSPAALAAAVTSWEKRSL